MSYFDKKRLYSKVDHIKSILPIAYPYSFFNMIDFLSKHVPDLKIETVPFKTFSLRGMAVIAENSSQNDVILLNDHLNDYEINFYCIHEFMHLRLHRNQKGKQFNCYDQTKPNQDPYLEWQANEGSAQFLVPYQDFIPRFLEYNSTHTPYISLNVLNELADYYCVSVPVIKNRIDNLNYEIDQYRNGISIENIELLSRNQQKMRGIQPTCYSNILDHELAWDAVI